MKRNVPLWVITLAAVLVSTTRGQVPPSEAYLAGQLSEFHARLNNSEENHPEFQQVETGQPFCCQKKYLGLVAVEIIAVQILPWYFNRHINDDSTAELSLNSWKRNVQEGFEWDPDNFKTNAFAHPFHGSVYFNAARSNGYSFWESAPFAFAGSFLWEFFGENNLASINDWANTSIGGITIGEGLHRAAKMLRDNRATGPGRTFRELGAFLFDPMGSFNRLIRGEMTRVGPNPSDRFPSSLRTDILLGGRAVGEGRLKNAGKPAFFGHLAINYGNPMEDYEHPFDAFQLTFQMNGRTEKTRMGLLQVHGVLYGSEVKSTEKVEHVFTIDQLYDYSNNQTYEVGGQSLAFSLRSRWHLSQQSKIQTLVQPSAYVVTGIISEPTIVGKRDYDYGSGLGFRLIGSYIHAGFEYATLGYRGIFSHTLNGAVGNQLVHFVFGRVRYPLWRSLGVGVEYILYMRDSYFRHFDDVHRRNPEIRAGAVFSL